MIEPPVKWEYQDRSGIHNSTGGYHSPVYRESHPMVRTRWEDNETIPSQLLVDLLNLLGSVGFNMDRDMIAAFKWAVENREKVDKLPMRPLKTVQELDLEGEFEHAPIKDTGFTKSGIRVDDENPDWRAYKQERAKGYQDAINLAKKFVRTGLSLQAADAVQAEIFETCYFAWSACYRSRVYPIQTLITLQGPSVEKNIMNFADGQHVEPGSADHDEILLAIGAAFLGRRFEREELIARGEPDRPTGRSDQELREWSRKNIDEIIDRLNDEPHGSDIRVIQQMKADEPWDALSLVYAYKRTFQKGEPWNVGISIDASQSGLQLLSTSLRDKAAMLATNVLQLMPGDCGPVDGYRAVLQQACNLLDATTEEMKAWGVPAGWAERNTLEPDVREMVTKILNYVDARKVSKVVAMPLVYGAQLISLIGSVREKIKKLDGIDLKERFSYLPTEEALKKRNEVITKTTQYLLQGCRLAYPKAMQALDWMTEVATISIQKQLAADVKLPRVEWTLSDGTVVSYWETELEIRRCKTLEFDTPRTPIGQGDTPKEDSMVSAFSPGWTHSIDALLLRTALKDWDIEKDGPITTVHDCIKVLPKALPVLRKRIGEAMKTVAQENKITDFAAQLGVDLDEVQTKLEYGPELVLDGLNLSRYIFYT